MRILRRPMRILRRLFRKLMPRPLPFPKPEPLTQEDVEALAKLLEVEIWISKRMNVVYIGWSKGPDSFRSFISGLGVGTGWVEFGNLWDYSYSMVDPWRWYRCRNAIIKVAKQRAGQ